MLASSRKENLGVHIASLTAAIKKEKPSLLPRAPKKALGPKAYLMPASFRLPSLERQTSGNGVFRSDTSLAKLIVQ